MARRGIEIFKGNKISGNIIPVHSDVVVGVHEHFDDMTKFISVSEDGSIAVVKSETLEVLKFDKLVNDRIAASAIINYQDQKQLLIGTVDGNLLLINKDFNAVPILDGQRSEITSICDFQDGTIVIAHGNDEEGSCIQYISLATEEVINEIRLLPGRKIKNMSKLERVKDKCIVSCSNSNLYWLKVADGMLKLIIDQPSPDYFYDEVWSDGLNVVKAGQSVFNSPSSSEYIMNKLIGEHQETRGKHHSMYVTEEVVIRGYREQIVFFDNEGISINKVHLPKGRFPMKILMHPYGRVLLGMHTGEIGIFEFRCSSIRWIVSS
ncbi:MAG: hypothetical protein H6622_13460 [Halobacteriovoraceae bacterium]|nr:hypothetical protein [Halobacteriovoraceae bacterium]